MPPKPVEPDVTFADIQKLEEELEELKYSIEGGYNDDANDLLGYIPKEIKDRLPVQEFDDGMDDY